MALDPFFQQGMNAWGARVGAQEGRAAKLNALVQSGQMKDALQQLAHKQKLTEADRTGEWDLAKQGLLKNLTTKRAATQFAPGTEASGNIANIQHAARIADSAQKMGGFPGFAEQIGQMFKNPAAVFGERGISPIFDKTTPVSQTRARLSAPLSGETGQRESTEGITIGSGKTAQPGLVRKTRVETSAKQKAKGSNPQAINNTLRALQGGQATVIKDPAYHAGVPGKIVQSKDGSLEFIGNDNSTYLKIDPTGLRKKN